MMITVVVLITQARRSSALGEMRAIVTERCACHLVVHGERRPPQDLAEALDTVAQVNSLTSRELAVVVHVPGCDRVRACTPVSE